MPKAHRVHQTQRLALPGLTFSKRDVSWSGAIVTARDLKSPSPAAADNALLTPHYHLEFQN